MRGKKRGSEAADVQSSWLVIVASVRRVKLNDGHYVVIVIVRVIVSLFSRKNEVEVEVEVRVGVEELFGCGKRKEKERRRKCRYKCEVKNEQGREHTGSSGLYKCRYMKGLQSPREEGKVTFETSRILRTVDLRSPHFSM